MIVAITGKKHAGKTTAAQYLVDTHGFREYAFAEPMKISLMVIFDWTSRHVYGDLKEELDPRWGISPRQALQHIGTEWGQFGLPAAFPEFAQVTGRKLWVRRFAAIHARAHRCTRWVISDLRFPHELEELRRIDDTLVVKIVRPGHESGDTHASEQIDEIEPDQTIINDGTIEQLQVCVAHLASKTSVAMSVDFSN